MNSSGCEPLTPDDIAEVVVFNAGRRENVVVADTLIFPNHQVSFFLAAVFISCELYWLSSWEIVFCAPRLHG